MDLTKIFVSHNWFTPMYTLQEGNHYDRFTELMCSAGYRFRDISIGSWNPIKGKPSTEKLLRTIQKRIAASDIVIVFADVTSANTLWVKRELELARKKLNQPKPVLAIKPYRKIFWSKLVTDHADAWATWNRGSIIGGIEALKRLTPTVREHLLAKGLPCELCGRRQPRLELSRLGGVYCSLCGAIAYRMPGYINSWRDRSRVYEGFKFGNVYTNGEFSSE